MDRALPDARVVDFELLISSLNLPDVDDRHVLAAALHARADVIVTWNLKDFPASVLSARSILAETPDDFICRLLDFDAEAALGALEADRRSLRNPPMTPQVYVAIIERARLVSAAARLRALGGSP